MGVDEIAVGGKEARVACLQNEQLVPGRPQNREIVGRHDPVAERPVDKLAVRHFEPDEVAGLDVVDICERSEEGRAMARDVDEAVLSRHVRAQISTGPPLERTFVGSVDEDHVQTEAADDDSTDRLSFCGPAAELRCGELDRSGLRGERFLPYVVLAGPGRELVLELLGEFVLLPSGVEAGEGVLPLPDDDDPGQGENTEDGQGNSGDSSESARSG